MALPLGSGTAAAFQSGESSGPAANLGSSGGKVVLIGRAVSADASTPADFADVLVGCRDALCATDADGAFRCRVNPPESDDLCIEHPRYGRTRIELEGRRGEIQLGVVKLVPGATIRVTKPPHLELPEGSTVTLLKGGEAVLPARAIRETVQFDGLSAAPYGVLLTGKEPLQRRQFSVDVRDPAGITELFLAVEPFRLTGEIAYGKTPLRASVGVQAEDWGAELQSDEDGRFSAEVWESGAYGVAIESGTLSQPHLVMLTASPSDSHWRIEIPSRRITGRFVDGETREAITSVNATLQSRSGNTAATRPLQVNEDGSFEVTGVGEGQYRLEARAEGYLAAAPVDIDVREFDGDQTLELPLWRGVQVPMKVVDAGGHPARDALVLIGFSDQVTEGDLKRTDAQGAVSIDLPKKGPPTAVFVLPREGSMAVAQVSPTDAERGVRLVVPRGDLTLRIETRTLDDLPLANVGFRLRRDGRELPRSVLYNLATSRRASTVTDPAGVLVLPGLPAGDYEIAWRLPAGLAKVEGWIRLPLVAGEMIVTERFAAVETPGR